MEIRVLPDAASVAEAAAGHIARSARATVARRHRFVLALSGGSTPDAMFEALAGRSVPWGAVEIHQVDERVAADGTPDRNATHMQEHLLDRIPTAAGRPTVLLLPVGSADLDAAARRAARRLAAAGRIDLVHLGIGADGHTASWPPGDTSVLRQDPVAAVGPYRGHRRLTTTPQAVNAARRRLVVAVGDDKAAAVARWLRCDPAVPVCHLRRSGTLVLLDEAAAGSVGAWTVPATI